MPSPKNWSNELLGLIQADPHASKVQSLVAQARQDANQALQSFRSWNYLRAVTKAYHAYVQLSKAAAKLGIENPSVVQALRAVPNGNVPHEGDPIRFPDN